jgi:hypothetical protein
MRQGLFKKTYFSFVSPQVVEGNVYISNIVHLLLSGCTAQNLDFMEFYRSHPLLGGGVLAMVHRFLSAVSNVYESSLTLLSR